MAEGTAPCLKLPETEVITIPLPFGAELKSILDASKPPSDCAVVHSLMLQLMPLLASMTCLLKMLKVMAAAEEVLKPLKEGISPTTPVDVLSAVVTKVLPALADLSKCFLVFDPCQIARMISAILGLLLRFLMCFVQAVESILNFQVGIDLDSAEGNPVLLAALTCAQDNAQTSLMNLQQALEVVQPLLDMISPLLELAGVPAIELPPMELESGSLAELFAQGKDPLAPVKDVLGVLAEAKKTVDAIC